MDVLGNRVKVHGTGGSVNTPFSLGVPVESFASFKDGTIRYTVLASTGEWQVGIGTVLGNLLSRVSVEENYLNTGDELDFSGLVIQIAQTHTALESNEITQKLDTIELGATGDQSGEEIKILYEAEPDTNPFDDAARDKLNLIEDEAKADQIAVEVPFTPTSNNPGLNVQDAIDNNNGLINTHGHLATVIEYDPSGDLITDATDVQFALSDHADGIEQRVASCSGLLSGGKLAGVIDTTVFSIEAGTGEIYDSYTDPIATEIIEQSWDEFLDISINPELGALTVASLKVFIKSSAGAPIVIKSTGEISYRTYRDHIFLGSINIVNGLITNISPAPSVVKQTATDTYDLMQSETRVNGGELLSVRDALSVWQKGGTLFYPGINWFNTDHKNPNIATFDDTSIDNGPNPRTPLLFSTMNQLGALTNINTETIIPLDYDLGGIVTALPVGKTTIHRMYTLGFEAATRRFVMLYGQTLYDSGDLAKNNLLTDSIVSPSEIDNLSFVGYVAVSSDSISFADGTRSWIISGSGGQTTSSAVQGTDHNNLANRELDNQHPISAIGGGTTATQLTTQLGNKTEYYGEWVAGTYPRNAMVTSGSYLSLVTAVAGTTDAPTPTLVGSPYNVFDAVTDTGGAPIPPPAFANANGGTVTIQSGHKYIFPSGQFLQQILINVPEVNVNTNYSVVTIIDPDGTTPKITIINLPTLTADAWTIIAADNIYVTAGTEILVYIEAHTTAGSTEYTNNFTWLKPANGDPSSGEVIINGGRDTLKISTTDNLGANIATELALIENSDTFLASQVSAGGNWEKFQFSDVGVLGGTAPNEFYTFPVFLGASGGQPDDNSDCNTTLDVFAEGDTLYKEDNDYFTGTSLDGIVDGYLKVDGVENVVPDRAYGIDITVQQATQSADWKILASSEAGTTSDGGDGGSTNATWGFIIGDITNQTDLNSILNTKVDDAQVLTNVPSGAEFTDTTYSIGNGGLTEVNFTSSLNSKLDNIPADANNYVHPVGDGNSHVPVNGTTNNLKVLTSGNTAGAYAWADNGIKRVADNVAPTTPFEGLVWFNTKDGFDYTWYAQGTGQWVVND